MKATDLQNLSYKSLQRRAVADARRYSAKKDLMIYMNELPDEWFLKGEASLALKFNFRAR